MGEGGIEGRERELTGITELPFGLSGGGVGRGISSVCAISAGSDRFSYPTLPRRMVTRTALAMDGNTSSVLKAQRSCYKFTRT